MAMDDRKQRIMMAIVSLHSIGGEPVGSNLLAHYFDLAVSSATLRNEMAALTRLGMLEQPHTSAGRVPTAKGYRYYVDNLLDGCGAGALAPADRENIDGIFHSLDYDPNKMAQGSAKALSDYLQYAVITTTPRAEGMSIAHFEVIQVGRFTAAVLAVTAAGGVSTRVAKVDYELSERDTQRTAAALDAYLRFVAEEDIDAALIRALIGSLGERGPRSWPLVSAALTLLAEASRANIYFEGTQCLLRWPELEGDFRPLMELLGDTAQLEKLLRPAGERTTVIFGDEFSGRPIPGLCLISRQYVAGGGLSGVIAVVGPARMRYREVIPRLEYFSAMLGKGMSGAAAG